ncbi:hypothetical protein I204_02675 [Kwoniella mangroviensis CBS 8886]|nr:hypothetical protein I204_02675 [Kwoniella mangroviensis CBS 8886]
MSISDRPSTPHPLSDYVLPHRFKVIGGGAGSLTELPKKQDIHALRSAIRLALRILNTPAAMQATNAALSIQHVPEREWHLPLPAPLESLTAPIDERVLQWQKEFIRTGPFQIVVDADLKEVYGCVDKYNAPHLIRINADLVIGAGEAYQQRETGRNTYEAHVLFLANTVMHELQHAMRGQLRNCLKFTPPKINNRFKYKSLGFDENGQELVKGQGGFWFEDQIIGGTLRGNILDTTSRFSISSIPLLKDLFITFAFPPSEPENENQANTRHTFRISCSDISAIVNGHPDWEQRLPFRPDGSYPISTGNHVPGTEYRPMLTPTNRYKCPDRDQSWRKLFPMPNSKAMSRESTLSVDVESDLEDEDASIIRTPPIPLNELVSNIQSLKPRPRAQPSHPSVFADTSNDLYKCGTDDGLVFFEKQLKWTGEEWQKYCDSLSKSHKSPTEDIV